MGHQAVKEGWTRVATPSSEFGTSTDIDRALALMGLSFDGAIGISASNGIPTSTRETPRPAIR